MKRREVGSLVVSFLVTVAFLALLAWLLKSTEQSADAASTADPSAGEVTVMLEPSANSRELIAVPEVASDSMPADAKSAADLSTQSAGNRDAHDVHQPPKPNPAEPLKSPASTAQAPSEQIKDASSEQKVVVAKTADSPKAADAPATTSVPATKESEVGDGDTPQLSGRGKMPPIQNVGDADAFIRAYPRLEVAWVLDARRQPGEEPPGVLVEAVLGEDGRLTIKNLRRNTSSSQYELVTMRHNCDELVRNIRPETMRIWKHRDSILAAAGLPSSQTSLIDWGYYRHQAELFYLTQVAAAYQRAAADGKVRFDPRKRDLIQVTWRQANGDSPPSISEARFVSHDGSSVKLPLGKE